MRRGGKNYGTRNPKQTEDYSYIKSILIYDIMADFVERPVDDHSSDRGFDELPFTYADPKQPHIYWICNYDQDEKITSVYVNQKEPKENNRYAGYLDTMEQAKWQRNELIKMGWKEFKLPQLTVSEKGGMTLGGGGASTRQQRRALERAHQKEQKRIKKLEREK